MNPHKMVSCNPFHSLCNIVLRGEEEGGLSLGTIAKGCLIS